MPPTVLLVDDSLTIHRVVELTLAGEAMDVAAVTTRSEALARLRQSPPDVVLADVGLPEPDGCALAALMKDDPRLSRVPIVLLQSGLEPLAGARAAAVPHDAVLSKPFEPGALIETVKRLVDRRGAAADPDATPAAKPVDPVEETADWAAADVVPPQDRADPLDAYFDRLDAAFADLRSKGLLHAGGSTEPATSSSDARAADNPFVALFAQESEEPPPARSESPVPPPAALPDEVLDQIAERVIARMDSDAMRRLVQDTAERLVREEIRRIKSMGNPESRIPDP